MSLLKDLQAAVAEPECPLCELINGSDPETKAALLAAAGGSMGVNKLAGILRVNDTGIGRRTVERHRREKHDPASR